MSTTQPVNQQVSQYDESHLLKETTSNADMFLKEEINGNSNIFDAKKKKCTLSRYKGYEVIKGAHENSTPDHHANRGALKFI